MTPQEIPGTFDIHHEIENLDIRIDRVVKFLTLYERPRIVAGNSQYRMSGKVRGDWVLLVFGSDGSIGVGPTKYRTSEDDVRFLFGKTLSKLLIDEIDEVNRMVGSAVLWDLAGKVLGKPIYELMGGQAKDTGVPVYDGSIYMEELISRDNNSEVRNAESTYVDRPSWQDIIKEAIDVSFDQGHVFAKVKIGRGALHLSRKAGNYQDAAVMRLIREHAGADFGIGVDGNNGYNLEDTLWLLDECGDLNLEFIEEMFPDDVEQYRQVRNKIDTLGLKTLIADGESWTGPNDPLAKEIIDSGIVNILQGDMRIFEFEGILQESQMAQVAGYGSYIAPHNWSSELGFYMQMHMACVIPNFYRGEHDPGVTQDEMLLKQGYRIEGGYCHDFASPGLGVEFNTTKLETMDRAFDITG